MGCRYGSRVVAFGAFCREHGPLILCNLAICIGIAITAAEWSLKRQIPSLNDFAVYYHASKVFFNPVELSRIYDYNYMEITYGVVIYRYLPSFLVIVNPLTMVDIVTSYYAFTTLSFCANVLSAYLAAGVVKRYFGLPPAPFQRHFMVFFFLGLFQVWNYGLGQVMSFLLLTVVASLHFFSTGNDIAGGFMLGLSIVVKPVMLFTILLAIAAISPMAKRIKVSVAILCPFVLDAVIFLTKPHLFGSFLSINLLDAGYWRCANSLSLTSWLDTVFFLNPSISRLCISTILVIAGLMNLRVIHELNKRVAFCFVFGTLSFMIAQGHVWSHNILLLVPTLLVVTGWVPAPWRERLLYACLVYQVTAVLFISDVFPPFSIVEPIVQLANVAILVFITGTVVWQMRDAPRPSIASTVWGTALPADR